MRDSGQQSVAFLHSFSRALPLTSYVALRSGLVTEPITANFYGTLRCHSATHQRSSALTWRGYRDLPNQVFFQRRYKNQMKRRATTREQGRLGGGLGALVGNPPMEIVCEFSWFFAPLCIHVCRAGCRDPGDESSRLVSESGFKVLQHIGRTPSTR